MCMCVCVCLTSNHTGTCKSADPERAVVMYRCETASQTVFSHTVLLFLCYKYSNNHRSAGISV